MQEQQQNGARRQYRHGDAVFPGVTDITSIINKPHLNKWRREYGWEESDRYMEDAKQFGTRVHEVAENAIRAGCTPQVCKCALLDKEMIPYHWAVVDFLDIYVDEVLGVEKQLVCPKLELGGTLDLYAKLLTGEPAVIDFKTSRSLQAEYGLQTAAYSMLLYTNGYPVDKRWVVHLKKDRPGEYNVKPYENDREDAEAFLSALSLWYWKYGSSHAKRQGLVI